MREETSNKVCAWVGGKGRGREEVIDRCRSAEVAVLLVEDVEDELVVFGPLDEVARVIDVKVCCRCVEACISVEGFLRV